MGVNSYTYPPPCDHSVHLGVELVLEDVEVVGGGDGDDVLRRVPGRVEDLLGEVQAVHADVVLPALPAGGAHPPWLQDGPGFAALPGRLQGHVTLGVPVEHAEEVVIGARHDHTGQGERGRDRRSEGSDRRERIQNVKLSCKVHFLPHGGF